MKELPNYIVSALVRYLPLLLAKIDQSKIRNDIRLYNAVRIIRHDILPKLRSVDKNNHKVK